jgi:hypothetical protein
MDVYASSTPTSRRRPWSSILGSAFQFISRPSPSLSPRSHEKAALPEIRDVTVREALVASTTDNRSQITDPRASEVFRINLASGRFSIPCVQSHQPISPSRSAVVPFVLLSKLCPHDAIGRGPIGLAGGRHRVAESGVVLDDWASGVEPADRFRHRP